MTFGSIMKYPIILLFFIFCVPFLSLPTEAQAQITITNSQAKGGQSANAPRFTPSQMASQWGGASQSQKEQHEQAKQAGQAEQGGENQAQNQNQAQNHVQNHDQNHDQPAMSDGTALAPTSDTPQGKGVHSPGMGAQTPPRQGPNAVITITPSTALKSGSSYGGNAEEPEEKSITSWSSNATKAIIHYQEPEEPKPSIGAPQLRPLTTE